MSFPVTYVLDRNAPSETFIRRETEQLLQRGWPLSIRYLNGDFNQIKGSLTACPPGRRWRFVKSAVARGLPELARCSKDTFSIIHRLPQVAGLSAKLTEKNTQLIHAHFAGITADVASIASATTGIPWSCAVHARDVFAASPNRIYRRLRTAARIVACSQLAADTVIATGISKHKVSVIRHGLPLHDYVYDMLRPEGMIFTACRLELKKGIDTLLTACSLLAQREINFRCVVAGNGTRQEFLKALAKRLGIEHSVLFIGWLSPEEIRSRILNASVLVLPSRRMPDGDRDGIANVLVEAMALGTPVVTTTAGAAGEIITDGVNGLLVPPDSPTALADALAQTLSVSPRMNALAKAARRTAEEHFDAENNIKALEKFLENAAQAMPA
ncbi:MAG: glycosyltransferase family 4 protein [Kiritimatiellae bacterium]|nr:glycosyltransferase family 4 protein [Kiritimatiellia bacterium]